MSAPYIQRFRVRYSDLDTNGHVANTAYLKFSLDTRIGYLFENGLTALLMKQSGIAPVVFREDITYLKELIVPEEIEVHFWVKSLHEDGIRFEWCTEIRRSNGELAARIDIKGGWMSLSKRRLEKPPKEAWDLLVALLVEDRLGPE